jgi:HKD family nuclease
MSVSTSYICQRHDSRKDGCFAGVIENLPNIERCKVVRVAVAYATVSGVRLLLSSVAAEQLQESYWLVGLDDAITQPGAIEMLQQEAGANVRVASYQSKGFRFHPKVFQFGYDIDLKKSVLVVGSNNLTSSAMRGNGEAFITVWPSTTAELSATDEFWKQLWNEGHEPTPAELKAYKAKYERAKRARKKLERVLGVKVAKPVVQEVLSSDDAEIDAALSSICWIECGAVTAMGRELEFKAEQGRFFRLSPSGGHAQQFKFRVSDGKVVTLRMKYQQNHMWRLQMNNEVPEVRTGLRPLLPDGSLGRSPYVAVFKRTKWPDTFDLQFLKVSSPAFSKLKDESERRGTVGRTSARQYGWC